jgi:hypothetical protein
MVCEKPMGHRSVLWLALATAALACAVVACSSSSAAGGNDGGGADATGDVRVDTGIEIDAGDSSTAHDASVDGDAASADANDGKAADASDGSSIDAPDELADAFSGDCGAGSAGEPLELECTGLYSDWANKTVASDLKSYTPGLTLWSDGATKNRWIYLPPGTTIDTSDMDEWSFPVGTKIFKEFSLPLGDASTSTRIETRMLWKTAAGPPGEPGTWYRTTYRWSDDGETSATELVNGQMDAGGTGYEVPNQFECDTCHNGRVDGVLGFEAVSLAAPGALGLDLTALEAAQLLTDNPTGSLAVPGDPTQAAAIGWFHANCGTACHNSGNGSASFTGFYMRLDVDTLGSVMDTDVYTTGWGQQTQGFTIPGATTSYRLEQCNTAESCAYYRPDHRDGLDGTQVGTQMPPLDTHKVDDPAVAQIAAWINEGCDAGGPVDAGGQ